LALAAICFSCAADADEVSVAVAANFAAPMQQIATAFARDTGHRAVLAFGSTGKLYAQIVHGAPFEVFLAADTRTPARLQAEGLAVTGTGFTYAVGRLALWSKNPGLIDQRAGVLRDGQFERIALADPKLAPYGAAALETLRSMGVEASVRSKMVQGESIAQAYQFIATENVALGFVALSQVYVEGRLREGSIWVVPEDLHAPIRQDVVLLDRGRENTAALSLLAYLRGPQARRIIEASGYALEQPADEP
jgi:molybdate transport system substrate-binding protein